jgi:outer membrane receptor protein involved in Fe transport
MLLVPTLALLCQTAAAADAVVVSETPPNLVVTATRLDSAPFDHPYALYSTERTEINEANGRTLTDALNYTPGVHMQRTATNQASPYIRGLTGEQSLLLFDGVRLNHAMNRPGPNQYAGMIPNQSIGRIDTILGSSSAVTGSDGLTGAIDFRLAETGRGVDRPLSPFAFARYGSADGESVGGGIDGQAGAWAYSVEGGLENYDDLEGGKDAGDHLFGSAAGDDTIPNSGYDQHHYAGRVAFLGVDRNRFDVAAGKTVQTDAPRPDGYFENSGVDTRISREYDPQEFTYVHLRHAITSEGWAQRVQTTLWSHEHHEEQVREDIQGVGAAARYRRRFTDDSISTLGGDLQLTSMAAEEHQLTYGGTYYVDCTDNESERHRSPAGNFDPNDAVLDQTDALFPGTTTVPDDAKYRGLGIFLQDSWQVTEQWNVLGGVRYSRSDWDYTVTDDRAGFDNIDPGATANPLASQNFSDSVDTVTAHLRVAYKPVTEVTTFAGIGQGFRAPNLSNLAGIQDSASSSSGGTGPQIQGNPDLDPEKSVTYEVGARFSEQADWAGISFFVTTLDDLIQVVYTDVDGDDTITAADSAQMLNAESGLIAGFELENDWGLPTFKLLPDDWRLAFVQSTSFVSGEADVPQPAAGGVTSEENISRANLFFGKAGLKLSWPNRWWALSQMRWQDAYDEPGRSDALDTRHLTFEAKGNASGAMPGYAVLDLKAGWSLPHERFFVIAAIENILNHSYRPVGSGVDGPGINAVLTAGARF